MSSKIPWVSCVYRGALPNTPQKRPISEWTIWPPMSGSESTRTTLRRSRADSIAADEPAIPAPTTHTSALTSCTTSGGRPGHRVQIQLGQRMRHERSRLTSAKACGNNLLLIGTVDSQAHGNKQKLLL